MTGVIWKYGLEITDAQSVRMPFGAVVLGVGAQGDALVMWARHDADEKRREHRAFLVLGTGNGFPVEVLGCHVGSVQMGPFVWHVFEAVR